MHDQNPYRATLRTDREPLEFRTLPLFETRAERLRREAARQRAMTFAGGAIFGVAMIAALAVVF
jgi:2-keto-3-deoxy-galactonokinase